MKDYELYCGDCLELLDNLPSVDVIITSPPYNLNLKVDKTGQYYSGGFNISRTLPYNQIRSKRYRNYTDDLPMEEYFNFQDAVIGKCLEKTRLMFYNIQMVTGNKVALFQLLGKYAGYIKEVIVWDKTNPQPAINSNVLNSQFEFIFVFDTVTPYRRSFEYAGFQKGTENNLWTVPREINDFHKASFPKRLIRKIIDDFTREGETILDPFMGSGTTGIVALERKRKFIGIEIDEVYFNHASELIKSAASYTGIDKFY